MVVRARKSDRTTPRPEEESGAGQGRSQGRQPRAAGQKPAKSQKPPAKSGHEVTTTESFPGKKKLNSAEQKLTPLTQC